MKANSFTIIFLSLAFLFFSFSTYAQNYTAIPHEFQFTRNLGLGNRGQDVMNLQCMLGVTDPTGYYGSMTSSAVLQFQNAHVAEILTPSGLTTGTGYLGSSTRAYMNIQIRNASSTNVSVVPTCPTYVPSVSEPQPINPNPIVNPQPITQLPNQNTQPAQQTQPQQQLPLIPFLNQNGTMSYLNPNANSDPNSLNALQSNCGTYYNPCSAYNYPSGTNVNNQYQNPNPNQYQPPPTSGGDAFYTNNANTAGIQRYNQTGNCRGHDQPGSADFYSNCPGHPNYHTDHVANSSRRCAIHPTIAYIEKDLLPRAFPGTTISSDCRVPGDGAPADYVHTNGLALDIQKGDEGMPKELEDKIVFWAQRPENFSLGLNRIIFNHQIWKFVPDSNGQNFHWSGPAPFDCSNARANADDCHERHVHFGI